MLDSYTILIRWALFITFLFAFLVWNIAVAYLSRYKKVYVLIHLFMKDEALSVNRRLGFIDKQAFPWWLSWYRNLMQVKRFLFQGTFVRSIPFTDIQQLYFRERTILIAITCSSLLLWIYLFTLLTDQL